MNQPIGRNRKALIDRPARSAAAEAHLRNAASGCEHRLSGIKRDFPELPADIVPGKRNHSEADQLRVELHVLHQTIDTEI